MTKSQIKRLCEIYLERASSGEINSEDLKTLGEMILALDKNQKDKEVDLDWNRRIEAITLQVVNLVHISLMRTGFANFTVIDGGERKE